MEKSKVIKIKKRIDGAEYPFVVIKNENELDNKLLARIKKELDLINKKGCVIYSRKIIKNENNLIRKYDNKKYKIRIAYLINKKEIKWTPRCLDENEFEFFRFKKLKSLEKFCIKLYNNYCKKWSKKKNYSEFAKEKKAIK
ncbi:MAG TPA: hypothetical protein PLN68_01830, partial [Elusimicrobiales bacterium]|nr:hypothetical protein [Elusimicrobiales bacterium]